MGVVFTHGIVWSFDLFVPCVEPGVPSFPRLHLATPPPIPIFLRIFRDLSNIIVGQPGDGNIPELHLRQHGEEICVDARSIDDVRPRRRLSSFRLGLELAVLQRRRRILLQSALPRDGRDSLKGYETRTGEQNPIWRLSNTVR